MGMKKLAALIMALVLCLVATGAMAATEVNSVDALKAAISQGATDIVITVSSLTFSNKEEITISNGKNIKLSAETNVTIATEEDDPFKVTNGTLTLGKGITVNAQSSILWANGGTINVDGAILNGIGKYSTAYANDGGVINVISGSINGKQTVRTPVALDLGKDGAANIKGGTVYSASSSAIAVREDSKLTISDGTVKSDAAADTDFAAIYTWDTGSVSMTGGTVTAKETQGMHVCGEATGIISGGSVSGAGAVYETEKGKLTISGGTYSDNSAANYLAEGLTLVGSGNKFVVKTIASLMAGTDLPQTGDNTSLMLWSAMLALAAVGFVASRKVRFN